MKLYVGGLPPSADDSTVAELLSAYGQVESVNLSKDAANGMNCLGYGFAKMVNIEEASKAIGALHNKLKLDPEQYPDIGPLQIRVLRDEPVANSGCNSSVEGDECGGLGQTTTAGRPTKLFIGGVPGTATGKMIRTLFQPYGEILDLFISPEKGYAFVKYANNEDALSAMVGVNGTTLPNGVRPLEVRVAQSTKGLDLPPESVDHPVSKKLAAAGAVHQQVDSLESTASTSASFGGSNENPRSIGDWTEYFSPSDGKPYYFNIKSSVTTWEAPVEFSISNSKVPPPPPAATSSDKGPMGSNIFVYGIPHSWSEKEFMVEFSKFGHILSTKIIYDKDSGASKGYGFISFTSPASADSAVSSMHGIQVVPNGKRLKVQIKRGEDPVAMVSRPY